jgi:hypothetical protein
LEGRLSFGQSPRVLGDLGIHQRRRWRRHE